MRKASTAARASTSPPPDASEPACPVSVSPPRRRLARALLDLHAVHQPLSVLPDELERAAVLVDHHGRRGVAVDLDLLDGGLHALVLLLGRLLAFLLGADLLEEVLGEPAAARGVVPGQQLGHLAHLVLVGPAAAVVAPAGGQGQAA